MSLNFNLRGIKPEAMAFLKKEAKASNVSVNFLILKLIDQGVGHATKGKRKKIHDLDNLANTWSEKDAQMFDQNIQLFESIDKELWL